MEVRKEISSLPGCLTALTSRYFLRQSWELPGQRALQKQVNANLMPYIHARYTMNNDPSWLKEETHDQEIPKIMWFPDQAYVHTYAAMTRMRPTELVKQRCARALIILKSFGRYQEIGAELMPELAYAALRISSIDGDEALSQKFIDDLEKRATE